MRFKPLKEDEELRPIEISEPKYSRPQVRIGNWYEELCRQEYEMKQFLRKKDRGELLIQKTKRMVDKLMLPVGVREVKEEFFKCGSVVQIGLNDPSPRIGVLGDPLLLSLTVDEEFIERCQEITENTEVVLSSKAEPCVRNTFRIKPLWKPFCDKLRYGDNFLLEVLTNAKESLYLYSCPNNTESLSRASSTSLAKENGQQLGLCYQTDLSKFSCRSSRVPLHYCRWKCVHSDRLQDEERQGTPIKSNETFYIVHSSTNRHLMALPAFVKTIFGPEAITTVAQLNHKSQSQSSKQRNAIWSFCSHFEELSS